MSEFTLSIIGVLAIAAVFGYLWFRRMRLHPSDDPHPAGKGNEE